MQTRHPAAGLPAAKQPATQVLGGTRLTAQARIWHRSAAAGIKIAAFPTMCVRNCAVPFLEAATMTATPQAHRLPKHLLVVLSACLVLLAGSASATLIWYSPLDGDATAVVGTNNGTVNGAVPTADRNGTPNAALLFDGSNDNVLIPKSEHPSFTQGTISAWARRDGGSGDRGVVNIGGHGGAGIEYFGVLARAGGNVYRADVDDGATRREVVSSVGDTAWHHVAVSFTGASRMHLYVDGTEVGSGTSLAGLSPTITPSNDWVIGSYQTGGLWFPGAIDDVAVWDNELHPTQVAALAAGTSPTALPPPPPPLIISVARTGSGLDPVPPEIRNGLLGEDALAFVDRTHEWNDFPGAHPELIGADYVKIANDDRSANPFRLNVGLAQPATVYVFRDKRVSGGSLTAMNQWMAAYGFQATGADIGVDESGDGDIDQRCDIFWGNFPAGSVDLFQQAQGGTNMYGVAAVPGHLAPNAHAYTPLGTGKTFLEQDGRVVVEAENYTSRATDGLHNWLIVPDESAPAGPFVANARGGKYVQCLPDALTPGLGPTNPPSIEYQVAIATPGQYQLYLRWDGNNTNSTLRGQSDSIFVDIVELKDGGGGAIADWYELTNPVNGDFASPPWDAGGGFEQNQAAASDNPIVWNFATPGIYNIRVSMREDGSNFDAIILQLSSLAAPTNPGPAESDFSTGAPVVLGSYSKLGGDPDLTHPLGIPGGLADGAPAFVDAAGNWTSVPPELLGSDYIRTENDDAGYGFADYSLILNNKGFLYIFLDDRYIATNGVPAWMGSLGFVDVGIDTLLDTGSAQLPFSIFQMNSGLPGGVATSLYGLGYDLQPAYDFYGIVVSDFAFVPEPATCTLVALGILAFAARRRRRRTR